MMKYDERQEGNCSKTIGVKKRRNVDTQERENICYENRSENEDEIVMILMPKSSWIEAETLANKFKMSVPLLIGLALKRLKIEVEKSVNK